MRAQRIPTVPTYGSYGRQWHWWQFDRRDPFWIGFYKGLYQMGAVICWPVMWVWRKTKDL